MTDSYHIPTALNRRSALLSGCPTTRRPGNAGKAADSQPRVESVGPSARVRRSWDAARLGLDCSRPAPTPPELGAAGGRHQPPPCAARSHNGARQELVAVAPVLVPSPGSRGAWGGNQGLGLLGKSLSTLSPLPHFEMAASRVLGCWEQRWGRERKCHPLQSGDGDVIATVSL